jgi:hypothetical protein
MQYVYITLEFGCLTGLPLLYVAPSCRDCTLTAATFYRPCPAFLRLIGGCDYEACSCLGAAGLIVTVVAAGK